MLSFLEEKFIREFLEDFPTTDLITVALNVTKHNLSPANREDAFKIICQHSECIESILEKRKITKSYLSQYLHKNEVSITDSWDKPALIRKVLEYRNIKKQNLIINDEHESEHSTSYSDHIPCNEIQTQIPHHETSQEFYHQLSHKFCEWFYSLINDEDVSKIGPEHFFTDSQMKLALQDRNCTDITEAKSSTDVAEVLRDIKLKYNFKFLPNLTPDAIRYNADIHGQVMIMVGGTLHSNPSQVVGLFEQMFLLIRDPSDNDNWKVKNSNVVLRSSNAITESSACSTPVLELCS